MRRPGSPVDWEVVRASFEQRVRREGPDDCHLRIGNLDNHGYGRFSIRIEGKRKTFRAMHLAFRLEHGHDPPPYPMEPDHLCRNHPCVNLRHLEWVTHQENVRRGQSLIARRANQTICDKGHQNWYIEASTGARRCRTCYLAYHRTYYDQHFRKPRKEVCKHGHPLSGENLYQYKGHRFCKTCRTRAKHDFRQRRNHGE